MFSSSSDATAKPKVTAMPLITTISTYMNRRAKFQNVPSWYMTTADISMKQLGNWINQKTQIGECLFCFLFLFHFMFVCVCVCVCVYVFYFSFWHHRILFFLKVFVPIRPMTGCHQNIFIIFYFQKNILSHILIYFI